MKKEEKYSFKVHYSEEDEGYIAECPEFSGLSAFGETPSEAIQEAEIALELFIETYEEEGKELPKPNLTKEYSGQIRVRLPKSLHARLAGMAEDEGVSLNTLMIQYLTEGFTSKKEQLSFEKMIDVFQKTSEIHRWNLGNIESKWIGQVNPYIQGSFNVSTGIQESSFFDFTGIKQSNKDNIEVV
ncbi:MAG: toxin-antitoxin system HicB family antitoxin [Spirochaetales bacterium]|nr:toxin-antitoxin system HicB family antitoxin [Spirochaetales bacterium]